MKKILFKFYGVPFVVNDYWPYFHEDFKSKMEEAGLEIGHFSINVQKGTFICFLRNKTHEFIYVVTDIIQLQGNDFLEGTDKKYNLKFHCRIKLRK